jgi:hypothetical protein
LALSGRVPLIISYLFQSSKFLSKRTSCSVATEPPPAATEEPEMDLPKEIFLKDYKKPDYLFDTVTRLSLFNFRISICTSISGKFLTAVAYGWLWTCD